ncbi:MAG: glutathione S-transferase C-terminal domain-containing protein [Rhodocyclaceae bacterium]|nr:glutathione S-transferase C-terminal domain-containing protein [Rhodocyclaceae bacterium]
MLEETGLPYEAHRVAFDRDDQLSEEFLSLNPNNKIPAIIDPDGPGRQAPAAVRVGRHPGLSRRQDRPAVAARSARTLPGPAVADVPDGGIGPMFGQLGFFHKFAGKDFEDKRPRDRYVAESRRLLGVLNRRLADRPWMMGDAYSIVDIATFPWVRVLVGFYEAGELVGIGDFPHVTRSLAHSSSGLPYSAD